MSPPSPRGPRARPVPAPGLPRPFLATPFPFRGLDPGSAANVEGKVKPSRLRPPLPRRGKSARVGLRRGRAECRHATRLELCTGASPGQPIAANQRARAVKVPSPALAPEEGIEGCNRSKGPDSTCGLASSAYARADRERARIDSPANRRSQPGEGPVCSSGASGTESKKLFSTPLQGDRQPLIGASRRSRSARLSAPGAPRAPRPRRVGGPVRPSRARSRRA